MKGKLQTIAMKVGLIVIGIVFISFYREANTEMDQVHQRITSPNDVHIIKTKVTVTAYSPTEDQCDNTPYITASNIEVRKGIVALSRDIEQKFDLKFGDQILLEGIGLFVFHDRMNKRHKKKVDIFMWSREKAKMFGSQETRLFIPMLEKL